MKNHTQGCYPDPAHPGFWYCTGEGHPQGPLVIDETMVERAARAMHANMGGLPDEFEQMHLDAARAALVAALGA